MLDYFCIFTRGGALLWTWQLTALRGDPIDALIRTCLLEERTGESSFTYKPPTGLPYTLKWTLHNGVGLVFVAVYQKTLKLLYVEELLARVAREFAQVYHPRTFDFAAFDARFQRALRDAEQSAAVGKPPLSHTGSPQPRNLQQRKGASQRGLANGGGSMQQGEGSADDDDSTGNNSSLNSSLNDLTLAADKNGHDPKDGAFDLDKVKNRLAKRPAAGGKAAAKKAASAAKDKAVPTKDKKPKAKAARKWSEGGGSKETDGGELDFSADKAEGDSRPNGGPADLSQASLVNAEEEDSDSEEDQDAALGAPEGEAPAKASLLSSFVRNISVSVVGTAALTREDIAPALDHLRRKLMERNVAEEIAAKLCESVASNLVGQQLGSFTRIGSAVRTAVEAALTRILTPRRSIDILREVQAAQARGKPYTIVFVGVNGVGKSTNLSKVAYWLLQNDIKVMIAACDTFRSGAVEQLKTHCGRLGIPLYERGYEKDPAKVAFEAAKQAQRSGCDVLLVDTAGRMQDNGPLMRALSALISLNQPDLVLFVGEALVGNDAVDQLTKFNQRLLDLSKADRAHAIDGILLTKFDTIDDKVGAALSMVYTSGAPIMFVGCGQTYVDLKRLNVKSIVRSLLK